MADSFDGSYLGTSRSELEVLIRRLVSDGTEGPKLDVKRTLSITTAAEKSELCKDLSAIANTDGDEFRGFGYIVVGAADGKLVGGVDVWKSVGADHFSAQLTQVAREYLAPAPNFRFVAYEDPEVGNWGWRRRQAQPSPPARS
ncbi:MAG: ATP-binding protein [Polyangiaceae bacterium]